MIKIGFIGGGNMAQALIAGLKKQASRDYEIITIEPSPQKCEALQLQYGILATDAWPQDYQVDVLVFAVKPQHLQQVAEQYALIAKDALVVSIAAAIKTDTLSRWLNHHKNIVRVMPNTPAMIGLGISGLFAMPEVSDKQKNIAEKLMEAVGQTLWLKTETQMDAITAVSGSGPAYVFYLLEAMQKGAEQLGFSNDEARQLTLATFEGAVMLAQQSELSLAELRSNVTSKGGTTEQAILHFENVHLSSLFQQGILAACKRSHELSSQLDL